MKKHNTLISGTITFLFCLGFFYLSIAGIFHSFSRHGSFQGVASIFFPPLAWYRSIELLWHKPEWKEKFEMNSQVFAFLMYIEFQGDAEPHQIPQLMREKETIVDWIKSMPRSEVQTLRSSALAFSEYLQKSENYLVNFLLESGDGSKTSDAINTICNNAISEESGINNQAMKNFFRDQLNSNQANIIDQLLGSDFNNERRNYEETQKVNMTHSIQLITAFKKERLDTYINGIFREN